MARILLVDDEKVAQSIYGDYLTAGGHEVTLSGALVEAAAALKATRFDAVVTDLLLPGGDGMEVLQLVKERYPGTEVIVITALDKVDPAVRAIKGGAAEYLIKPVAPEALQHAVSRALTTRQLLQENAALRRHVLLVEAGQRLVTLLDRKRVLAAAATAFSQVTQAQASLILLRNGKDWKAEADHGLSPEQGGELARVLRGALQDEPSNAFEHLEEVAPFERAFVVPVADSSGLLGYALLFFPGALPEGVQAAATYLTQHLALALETVGRFAAVEDLAYVDDLTHLYNGRFLDQALTRELSSAKERKGSFSVLFLDLDYFKSINDTHGHMVGSKLLVEAARIIKSCTRDQDVVARYGGDEYVVLLHDTDSGGALKVAERIRRAVESHHFLAREGYSLSISTCVGIASFPEHAQDKATLLDLADRAMYRGKKTSRNVIYVAAKDLEATPTDRHRKVQPT